MVQTVFVATYEHRYGRDLRVFSNEEAAQNWKNEVFEEWGTVEFPDDPPSNAEEYFERMAEQPGHEEFFTIEAVSVED